MLYSGFTKMLPKMLGIKSHKMIALMMSPKRHLSQETTAHTNPPPNVDQREVDTLAKLAEEWWNPTGPLKGLHSMNALRVPLIRDGLIATSVVPQEQIQTPQVLKGVNILEVGCGGGILTEALARIHANVVGIDPGQKLINVAREHAERDRKITSRIQYLEETVEEHARRNVEKYDAVIASEVLEHVNDKVAFLEHCVMALRPGGSIFVTTLNQTTASWVGGIVAAEYILKLVPENTHDWEKFISPLDLQRLLKTFNCTTVLVHGMSYEFWRNSWSWCKRTDINYAVQAVKMAEN